MRKNDPRQADMVSFKVILTSIGIVTIIWPFFSKPPDWAGTREVLISFAIGSVLLSISVLGYSKSHLWLRITGITFFSIAIFLLLTVLIFAKSIAGIGIKF